MIKKINDHVKYIGVDDLKLDLFESQYVIPEGMAYNSYLVSDEKVAIMDTVETHFADEWIENLSTALEGRKPDYLVVQHVEPDHSGVIIKLLAEYPDLKLVCSAKAVAMLGQFFDAAPLEGRTMVVKEGDELSLGGLTLKFIAAPMVHWPEVIVTYCPEDKILFSADAFGKFGALSKCGYFSEEEQDWACEARRYYFNICGKYGGPVQTLLKKASALDIETICPLHGPILRGDLSEYLRLYNIWSTYGVESEGVFVAYASIHGGTAVVAEKFAQMLRDRGVKKVVLTDLCRSDFAENVEDAFRYGTLVLAACSYDAGLYPPAFEFIHHLQDKAWQKRRVALIENGSWAPSAGRVMREMFSTMKDVEIIEPTVTIRSSLKPADIPCLEALADEVAK